MKVAVPLEDRVVIRMQKAPEKTKGGLHLPQGIKEDTLESLRGTVLAAGPGRLIENGARAPMQVKKGDIVLLNKYAGTDVTINGETLRIVNETEILGIEKDEPDQAVA